MLLLLFFLFTNHILTSDQEELIRKFPDDVWNKAEPAMKQELLAQRQMIKLLENKIEKSKTNSKKEITFDPWTNVIKYILKPDCRNDLK